MKGILLAAGRGSRMGMLTDDRPKCLVELGGRPLLEWQIASLRAAGVIRLAAVKGWQGERLANRGVDLVDNPRWAETNMVGSLACMSSWLKTEPCVVSYSDIFYHPEAVTALVNAPGHVTIAYDPAWLALWSRRFTDVLSDAESFRLDEAGQVIEIGRRAGSIKEIRGQYMGLLRITPAGWTGIESILSSLSPLERDRLDMTSLLRLLIKAAIPVHAVPIASYWGEVDSPDDLALYQRMIAEGTLVLPEFPASA